MINKFCLIILLCVAFLRSVPDVTILGSAVVVVIAALFGFIVLFALMWLILVGRVLLVWALFPFVGGFLPFVDWLFFSDPGFTLVRAVRVLIGALLRFLAVGVSNWSFFFMLVNIFFGFLVDVPLFFRPFSILCTSHRLFTLILCLLVVPILIVGLSRL